MVCQYYVLGFGDFWVWGLRFEVWGLGLGFGVWGLGFGVWGLGFGVWGLGFSLARMEGQMIAGGFIVYAWRMYVACLDTIGLHLNDD